MSYTSIIINSGTSSVGSPIGVLISATTSDIQKGTSYVLQFKARSLNSQRTLDNIYVGTQKIPNINMESFETVLIEGVEFYNCYAVFVANSNMVTPSVTIGKIKTNSDSNNTDIFEITEIGLFQGTNNKEYQANNYDIQIIKKEMYSKIEQLSDKISLKTDKKEIDSINNKLTKAMGQIQVATGEISLRATTEEVNGLESRVYTAESKLDKKGLTTIIGDYYTTAGDVDGLVSSKGYATTSQVQQTKNELTATFKSSGGYNLLYNGDFKTDLSHWDNNGASRSTGLGSTSGVGIYISGSLNTTKYICQLINLDPNESAYTVSCELRISSTGSIGGTNPMMQLYFEPIYTDGSVSYYGVGTNPSNTWTKIHKTIERPSGKKFSQMRVYIYVRDTTKVVHASNIMVEKGTVASAWSPNPNEVHDGITKIDKNGITVTQSNAKSKTTMSADGFAITRTDNNKDIFRVGSNGKLTLNGDFLCYRDGANQSGPRLESSGAMMYGYNDTGGSHPVFASGLWADQDMGYFSVGYTRADVTDANGCLWLSPQHDNAGCRLTFSRLIGTEMKTTNLYFQKDGSIDFIQNLRGYNTTDDNYTYRFDSGVSVQAFRCNHIRTHNIYPRNNGSHNIGSPTMRYKDAFFDSASTTNSEFRIGTINTDGSWKTYGPLCVNSSSGYVFPSSNANLSLGMSSYRFHTLFCTNNPNVSSDKRMKTDIHYLGMPYEPEIVNGRSKVNMDVTTGDMRDFVRDELKLASYRYKVNIGKGDTSVDYGFIAQDILYTKVGSEIVQLEDLDNLDSNLSYNQGNYITTIAGALQEEIKIRDKQIAELEDKVIGRLQEEIKMKDAQINDLESRLAKLENIIEQLIEK